MYEEADSRPPRWPAYSIIAAVLRRGVDPKAPREAIWNCGFGWTSTPNGKTDRTLPWNWYDLYLKLDDPPP